MSVIVREWNINMCLRGWDACMCVCCVPSCALCPWFSMCVFVYHPCKWLTCRLSVYVYWFVCFRNALSLVTIFHPVRYFEEYNLIVYQIDPTLPIMQLVASSCSTPLPGKCAHLSKYYISVVNLQSPHLSCHRGLFSQT